MQTPSILFQDVYKNNKYLIKISSTNTNNWVIYMFKNKDIQLDVQTVHSLTSSYIDIDTLIDYIEKTDSIKIKYTFYYDDYENYRTLIHNLLDKIKMHYVDKNIIIKNKFYYN
jgi:hypothetical protein